MLVLWGANSFYLGKKLGRYRFNLEPYKQKGKLLLRRIEYPINQASFSSPKIPLVLPPSRSQIPSKIECLPLKLSSPAVGTIIPST